MRRGPRGLLVLVFAFAWICCSAAGAVAQPEPDDDVLAPDDSGVEPDDDVLDPEGQVDAARQAFAAGTEAYQAGLYEEALTSFQRAYRLTGTPDVLYNIARAADRLDHNELALTHYQRYLELRPEAEDREHVEDRILSLRALLQGDGSAADPPPEVEPDPDPDPDPDPAPPPPEPVEEGPGAGPFILAGVGVTLAAAGTLVYLLADSAVALVGAGVGGAMLVGGVVWAVSF